MANVLPSARVKVAEPIGAVIATLFTEVAEATPRVGAVKIGAVSVLLVKVSVPTKVASVPDVGKVTFVAPLDVNVIGFAPDVANVLPSARVNVAALLGAVIATLFTEVAEATPIIGVIKVGVLALTTAPPVPVIEISSTTPAPTVVRPNNVLVLIFCILLSVTAPAVIVVVLLFELVTSPAKLALVVTVAALPLILPTIVEVKV